MRAAAHPFPPSSPLPPPSISSPSFSYSPGYHHVLRAIYRVDQPREEHVGAAVADHVSAASNQRRVVPLAILLAAAGDTLSVAGGVRVLEEEPIVRKAIHRVLRETIEG